MEAKKEQRREDGEGEEEQEEVIAAGFECTGALGRGFKALIVDLCAEEYIGKITGVEDYH